MIFNLRGIRVALLVVAMFAIASCGFTLRSEQSLPPGYTQVYLAGVQDYSPFRRMVELQLSLYSIPWVTALAQDKRDETVSILLMPDTLDRRLLSLFPTGQVAEYELVLSIRYQLVFADRPPQLIEFDVTREYQDDPDAILAKSRELDLVLTELRRQAAERMIRMLPSQASQNP